ELAARADIADQAGEGPVTADVVLGAGRAAVPVGDGLDRERGALGGRQVRVGHPGQGLSFGSDCSGAVSGGQRRSIITLVDLMTAVAGAPGTRFSSSADSRLISDTTRNGPACTSTWAATSPSTTSVTIPGNRLRAEDGLPSASA